MIQQKMDDLDFFFTHVFVRSGNGKGDNNDDPAPETKNTQKHGTENEKEVPAHWKVADDPELPPGYKKIYYYLTEDWKPCEKKDADNCYIVNSTFIVIRDETYLEISSEHLKCLLFSPRASVSVIIFPFTS